MELEQELKSARHASVPEPPNVDGRTLEVKGLIHWR